MANEIAILNNHQVSLPEREAVSELLTELADIGGELELGRVKLAASGTPIFEIIEMGADESDTAKTIDAVILFSQKQNIRWPEDSNVGGQQPLCRSYDGIHGQDQDGLTLDCASCPMNRFGSAPNGGKACKNTIVLYLMRPAEGERPADLLPLKLQLPATSINAWNRYRTFLAMRGVKLASALTRLSVVKTTNKAGVAYGEANFKLVGKLPPDQAAVVASYAESFKASIVPQSRVPAGFQQVEYEEDSPF